MTQLCARAGRLAGRVALVLGVLAFTLLVVGPQTGRYRTLTVLSASMRPTFAPGSVVLVVPVPIADVAVGDVITYAIPVDDHHIVTHRVVEVVEPGVVRTRGDANGAPDPWLARLRGSTAWKVRAVVPEVGHAIEAFRLPAVRLASVLVPTALATALALRGVWRRPRGA